MATITRTSDTEEKYTKKAIALLSQFEEDHNIPWDSDFSIFKGWLEEKRSDLKKASWRQYRAALVYHLNTINSNQEHISYISNISTAKCKRKSRKTSAQKEKKITQNEMFDLAEYLLEGRSKWDSLICSWLETSIITGLRPQEWESADLDGLYLKVQNAKNTNGRCFSSSRTLDLSQLEEDDYDTIETFMGRLHFVVMEHEGDFQHVYTQCRVRLYEVTRKLWPSRDRYPTLYTGRHQFSANAKKNQSRSNVAALMGHKTDATATEHYGKRVHGEELPTMVLPIPEEVKMVERKFTAPDFDHQKSKFDRGGDPA